MKPNAGILMYSGRENPEKELTDQEITDIRSLVSGLNEPYPGEFHGQLGFSGYFVSIDNVHVIAKLYGAIQIFDEQGQEKAYWDTTGLLAYLCKIMTPVMIKHQQDAQKAIEEWQASQMEYEPPTWET